MSGIHDHDVVLAQRRDQNLGQIEAKTFAVDRPLEEPWCVDAVMARGGQEGHGLPAATWHLGFDPLAARRPASEWRHIRLGPGLVDEHQAGGVDPISIFDPLSAMPRDVGTVLLSRDQRLFL